MSVLEFLLFSLSFHAIKIHKPEMLVSCYMILSHNVVPDKAISLAAIQAKKQAAESGL